MRLRKNQRIICVCRDCLAYKLQFGQANRGFQLLEACPMNEVSALGGACPMNEVSALGAG